MTVLLIKVMPTQIEAGLMKINAFAEIEIGFANCPMPRFPLTQIPAPKRLVPKSPYLPLNDPHLHVSSLYSD